jgi:peptidoglycan/LPS O-acetylase OafA/YrhL
MPGEPNATGTPTKEIGFIQLLRGVAVLLVMWDHLVGSWLDTNHRSWVPLREVRDYVTAPTGIIQDFGWLGVVLFFLVSGFIITHVGRRETRVEFGVKRLLRIYPPLIFSILLIIGIAALRPSLGLPRDLPTFSFGTILRSMTLENYLTIPQQPVNGVAWTLCIEVAFYSLCWVLLPLLRRYPVVAVATGLATTLVIMRTARSFAGSWFLFAVIVSYLPLLMLGQIAYLRWCKAISIRSFILLSACAYLAFMYGLYHINPTFLPADNSYGVSLFYGYAIFSAMLIFGSELKPGRVIGFWSRTSYSVYLVHGTIGVLVLDLLVTKANVPFTIALIGAVLAVALVSAVTQRWIERPPQLLARRLLASWSHRTSRTRLRRSNRTSTVGVPQVGIE